MDESQACKAREARIAWSQTGQGAKDDKGDKGDKGDPGPPGGGSDAYIARNNAVPLQPGVRTEVASLTVPAGSYVINGKAALGSIATNATCALSTGDSSVGVVPAAFRLTLPLQDAAAFGSDTTISMTCLSVAGDFATQVVLTAISVGAIN